jgi:DNA-binding CsgD family transcriptional regulator
MSTRGLSAGFSALDQVTDLQALVDHLGLERFLLMARGPNGHAAIRYAAANPQKVEALILFSLPAHGNAWPKTFAQALPAENWKLFLQSFTAFDGRSHDPDESVGRMAQTVTQEDWTILIREWIASDVRDLLSLIRTPTLVIHPRNVIQPSVDESMKVAANLPDGRILVIDGSTQLGDPQEGLAAVDAFLASLPNRSASATGSSPLGAPSLHEVEVLRRPVQKESSSPNLSPRQSQVLSLIATGKTNREIASELVLSLRTVERHVNDIYARLGVRNRTEAVAFALKNLR